MRYQYYIHLTDSDNLSSSIYRSNVSKCDLHKMIDFYFKNFNVNGIFIRPCIEFTPSPAAMSGKRKEKNVSSRQNCRN